MSANTKKRAIILHEKDNVATALEDLKKGEVIQFPEAGLTVELLEDINLGHKFSLADIEDGAKVYKYGAAIGAATKPILLGQHVHLHNIRSLQLKGDYHEGIQEGQWQNRNS